MESNKRLVAARSLVNKFSTAFACNTIPTEELIERCLSSHMQKPILVDVRSSFERNTSYIPGSCTKEQFEQRYFSKNENGNTFIREEYLKLEIIPYCTIGYRSAKYYKHLHELGFQNVRNGEGIVIWTHFAAPDSSLALVRDGQDTTVEITREVNCFSSRFDFAAGEYRSVYLSYSQLFVLGFCELLFFSINYNGQQAAVLYPLWRLWPQSSPRRGPCAERLPSPGRPGPSGQPWRSWLWICP